MATKLGELAIQVYVLPIMEFHVNRYTNLAFSGGRRGERFCQSAFYNQETRSILHWLFINALYLDSIMWSLSQPA